MFTRFLNSIRDSMNRGPTNRTTNSNTNRHPDHNSNEFNDSLRRPSVTEELQSNDTHNLFADTSRLGRNNSIAASEPIPINETTFAGSKRRNSIFGISNVTADDYVQKDLISSSWS
jgi:hypothetical protein